MGYQGNYPPSTPLTSSQIGAGAVDTTALATDAVQTVDIANGAVTVPKLSATGTASSSTFLRGDGTWAAAKLPLAAVQTTGFTAAANTIYLCNTTSAAFTVTLPASPTAGDQITIVDYAGTAGTNYITISPNGNKIQGSTTNAAIVTNRQSLNLIYADSTQGWVSYSQQYAAAATPYSVDYLVVAGGAGGGGSSGAGPNSQYGAAGGGAGGYQAGSATAYSGTNYSISVGAGGAGRSGYNNGANGNNSTLATLLATASVGGGGGGYDTGPSGSAGSSGGSGGGGGSVNGAGGSGTAGQGNNGGSGYSAGNAGGGGGGGAGATGSNAGASLGGNGGAGLNWQSLGTFYAGGGGGGVFNSGATAGTGGNGGGGAGASYGTSGTSGTANTGGGGGGAAGGAGSATTGGNGGSGVVIIRYSGSQRGSGGTVTSAGGYTYHTFTSSSTYTA